MKSQGPIVADIPVLPLELSQYRRDKCEKNKWREWNISPEFPKTYGRDSTKSATKNPSQTK
jgi:hypothetical protein